ncbi:hypothetical protein J5I95_19420 [Candidatus Poribacteria bacterium]|nr:hypothetical protein [Candidatus Poribacteria bacterium]
MMEKTIRQIHAAAVIFAKRNGCSAQEIADILDMPVSIIYRFRKSHDWDETLDALDYTGDRNFTRQVTRDAQRDAPELVEQARGLYTQERRNGRNHKKAVTAVCEVLKIKRRRVNEWAEKYHWEDAL